CYLTDLDEKEVKSGPWPLGKNGDVGAGRAIEVNGFKFPMGMGMHPPDSGEALVKYEIGGSWKTLVAQVAINDLQEPFAGSVTFVVLGDGEVLWKSPSIESRGVVAACQVNVKGVKILQLKTQASGRAHGAHAVWLDPRLLK